MLPRAHRRPYLGRPRAEALQRLVEVHAVHPPLEVDEAAAPGRQHPPLHLGSGNFKFNYFFLIAVILNAERDTKICVNEQATNDPLKGAAKRMGGIT